MSKPDNPRADALPTGDRAKQLRQLAHDAGNDLHAIAMGLEALKWVREDPEEFERVCASVHEGGLTPLKEKIAILLQQLPQAQE